MSGTLTRSQAERRARVIRAAIELGAEGGYDAVQMRDVATRADVALGTIYRYFASKDHLLAAAMVEWVDDLERQVTRHPPSGSSTADRVVNVLRRAISAMEREPRLSEAVVTALAMSDADASVHQVATNATMGRIMEHAFPEGFDAADRAALTRILGHVWFSALVAWVNGWRGFDEVGAEVELAAHHLLDQY